ncbi:orotidine 5'-phosphate decarboxylase [Lentibacillus kapialis]|uniref:Orotidine 5'-phosphate decarboxylase n=1 Tax=Lentibacillus kapialis TaxID=340214 RepID=A0A917UUB9_9BACI|nr:orotidine-5'-phosphate decarboxylase [Lentibacillus kapialis]GGJ86485.1 orotidine 5'-phosphate decarboxylase [Lentibacillus kapialis]
MTNKIFLALDFPTLDEARSFIDQNELQGVPVKVGMELFYREGPRLIELLKQNGHDIFLDLKLHDIPITVERAMKNLAGLGVDMVNVHALGGGDMIKRAKEGLMAGVAVGVIPKLLAVTILTSMDNHILNREMKIEGNLQDNILHLSELAAKNGADGVVCAAHEAKKIKDMCGKSFLTVTPGIRLAESPDDDQKRVATPAAAREGGADMLVVGRTITNAKEPKAAYEKVEKEWLYGVKL